MNNISELKCLDCNHAGFFVHSQENECTRYRSKQYSCDLSLLSSGLERFLVWEQLSSPHPFATFSDTFHALVPISDCY